MANRVYKNLVVAASGQFFNKFLGLFWLFLSARYLGSGAFGILSIATSIAAILSVFMEFGLSSLMIREVSRDHRLIPVYIENFFSLKGILGISSLILCWILCLVLGYSADIVITTIIIALSMFVYSITSIGTSVFWGTEKMEYPSIAAIISKIFSLAVGVLFIFMHRGLYWIALVLLLERLCEVVVIYYYVSKQYRIDYQPKFDRRFQSITIRETLPFALASLFGMLYYKIDIIILSKFTNETQVGWYSAGFRLQDSFVLFFGSFVTTIFPVLSRQFGTGQLSRSLKRSFEFILMSVIPLSLFLFFLSEKIVLAFYGSRFADSAAVVRLLALALPFTFLNYFLGAALGAINKQKILFYITVIAVIINLGLNLVLIYNMQYIGAALSAVITAVCVWLLYTWALSIHISLPFDWHFAGKFVLPCAGIMLVVFLGLNLVWSLAAGGSLYLLLLFVTGLVSKNEVKELFLSFKRSSYA
jgi:O-antigen/teichoic acid export membrane protein